jgi:hypothetical protein
MYLIHKRAHVRRHYRRGRFECGVSTGFINPVQGASELPHTKIKALTHSRAFTYRFWRVQALPLSQLRFLRPRNGRGEIAICPGKWPRRCPQARSVRVRSGAVSSPRPGPVQKQSVSAPQPCPQQCPGHARRRIRGQSMSVAVRIQSVSSNYPCPVRIRAGFTSGSA